MVLEGLLQALERDAEHELSEAIAEDRSRAEAILAVAHGQAENLRRHRLHEVRSQGLAEAERLLATARAQVRREDRESVETRLRRVRVDTAEALRDFRGTAEASAATLALFEEAMAALPEATAARVGPESAADIQRLVGQRWPGLRLEIDLDDLGVVLTDDAGRRLENTASVRLANDWPDARAAVARLWRTG